MTRKQLDRIVDGIAVRIAEANGFDISGKSTSVGVMATNALTGLALERLADRIVEAGIAGNRLPAAPPVPVAGLVA